MFESSTSSGYSDSEDAYLVELRVAADLATTDVDKQRSEENRRTIDEPTRDAARSFLRAAFKARQDEIEGSATEEKPLVEPPESESETN